MTIFRFDEDTHRFTTKHLSAHLSTRMHSTFDVQGKLYQETWHRNGELAPRAMRYRITVGGTLAASLGICNTTGLVEVDAPGLIHARVAELQRGAVVLPSIGAPLSDTSKWALRHCELAWARRGYFVLSVDAYHDGAHLDSKDVAAFLDPQQARSAMRGQRNRIAMLRQHTSAKLLERLEWQVWHVSESDDAPLFTRAAALAWGGSSR